MDDIQLAQRLKQDDESALEAVIKKYTPIVSTIISNLACGHLSTEDIEEVASDTFIALWYCREKIIDDKLRGFIFRIAKNKARDKLRKADDEEMVDVEETVVEDKLTVADQVETAFVNKLLREAIDSIGEPDDEIVIRHYYYYQSASEIAERMKMNVDTVKSKIRRTRDKLKKILTERGFIR